MRLVRLKIFGKRLNHGKSILKIGRHGAEFNKQANRGKGQSRL
jgi:hypothetical protein